MKLAEQLIIQSGVIRREHGIERRHGGRSDALPQWRFFLLRLVVIGGPEFAADRRSSGALHRFVVEAQLDQRLHHKRAGLQFMAQGGMTFRTITRLHHFTVGIDLRFERFRPVKLFAG